MPFRHVYAIPNPEHCPVCGSEAKALTAQGWAEDTTSQITWGEKLAECPDGHLWRLSSWRWSDAVHSDA